MTDEPAFESPLWWLRALDQKLERRRPFIRRFESYYDGLHRLSFATSRFRESFGNLFAAFADNWCDLVVDASVERLSVEGFRYGTDSGGDDAAWRLWQANDLDADAAIAHTESVKCGEAYIIVGPGDAADTPRITIERPAEVVVQNAPGSRHLRLAALKKWVELDGTVMATVYLPDAVYRFQADMPVSTLADALLNTRWVPRRDDVGAVEHHDLGVVPVIPLMNNPSMLAGRSDIAQVIPMQDAINKLVADMIVASEFASFRQRWATGIEIPIDPITGQPLTQQFLSSVANVWTVPEGEGVTFGEFGASDLGNYVRAVEMLVQHVAAQTRTPPHYLLGSSGTFPSGESLKAVETGLVAKVRRKQVVFGEAWEEAMRLAFKLAGDAERAGAESSQVIWRDPESRTEGERVDALVKMATLGVPREALWEKWGATPQEIARWQDMAAAEEARAQFAGIGLAVDPNAPHPITAAPAAPFVPGSPLPRPGADAGAG